MWESSKDQPRIIEFGIKVYKLILWKRGNDIINKN